MAKELGKNWRMYVGDGATPTEGFDVMGGEGSLSWSRASTEIDMTTKDDGVYGAQQFGLQSIKFGVSGKLSLPDDAMSRINTVAKSGTPEVNIQIKKGSIVKYAGEVSVGNLSLEFPTEGAATYSFTLVASETPTTDNLAATS